LAQRDEVELVRRIQAGEKELFYELLRPCERSVYLTAYSILQNQADAEEVAQEAVLKSFRYINNFRGESKFSTWLTRIAIHEARMRIRKDRKQLFDSIEARVNENAEESSGDYTPLLLADWREVPSEILERKEIREEIAKALAQLPESYREVLILRDIEHMSIAATADALGIKPALVKIRLFRARLRMRDLLAPQLADQLSNRKRFKKGPKPWS